MSNTAEIYKFPAPVPTQQECRMADLENGYLRLANQIQDALCKGELYCPVCAKAKALAAAGIKWKAE